MTFEAVGRAPTVKFSAEGALQMPLVKIDLFPGRTPETKSEIADEITKLFESIAGVPPKDTIVIFNEVPATQWFVAGEALSKQRAH